MADPLFAGGYGVGAMPLFPEMKRPVSVEKRKSLLEINHQTRKKVIPDVKKQIINKKDFIMSNEINVVINKPKSNATWILGIIAFITSLPNFLCATICAGVAAAAATENGTAQEDAVGAAGMMLYTILIASIVCFILSFFGKKSKVSVVTGIVMILGSLWILINGFIGFGSILWGTATGVMYLISGILSIVNSKRA